MDTHTFHLTKRKDRKQFQQTKTKPTAKSKMASTQDQHPTYPIIGPASIMALKAHGTSEVPVQENLRWACDATVADRVCNFNRHYAEYSGYFQTRKTFLKDVKEGHEITYYDSNTGKPLFVVPRGERTWEEFLEESEDHGWPSFRDGEVVWENVRCLSIGDRGESECVSVDGTHLGHNIPDRKGNRYCINLVSIAGNPVEAK